MPLPPSLGATFNAIEFLRRHTSRICGVKSNFQALFHIVGFTLRKRNVLPVALERDRAPGGYLSPSIIHLAYQHTRLGFIEGGGNVEALMAVRITAGEPAEMHLVRTDRPFDAVEDAFIPSRTVDVQFIGEDIELVSADADPATHTMRDLG
jgi:hypothetical protein